MAAKRERASPTCVIIDTLDLTSIDPRVRLPDHAPAAGGADPVGVGVLGAIPCLAAGDRLARAARPRRYLHCCSNRDARSMPMGGGAVEVRSSTAMRVRRFATRLADAAR